MAAPQLEFDASRPIVLSDADFARDKYDWYPVLLDEAPVARARISVIRLTVVARYDDCRTVLTDPRFVRNRGRAKGKDYESPVPIPLPRSILALTRSMIVEDDPQHRRLRGLVNQAFTARAVSRLSDRVEEVTGRLLDRLSGCGSFDLIEAYARPIPTRVIAEIVGLPEADMDELEHSVGVLTKGFSGFHVLRTLFWDLRGVARFFRELIARKRRHPGADILSELIAAEEAGDRLSEDELVGMVFLLIVAGFETTQHLIANGVRTLIEHPEALDRLRAEPSLWDSAVEEIVRFRGPIQSTKPQFPTQDVTLQGVTIRRATPVMPLLGAANLDPRAFDRPHVFDITRSPNHHLGFGFGNHFCLGRQLALMETRIALSRLFERHPALRLAVEPSELEIVAVPGWHRHARLPVQLERDQPSS